MGSGGSSFLWLSSKLFGVSLLRQSLRLSVFRSYLSAYLKRLNSPAYSTPNKVEKKKFCLEHFHLFIKSDSVLAFSCLSTFILHHTIHLGLYGQASRAISTG